jgi:hypothetical protein
MSHVSADDSMDVSAGVVPTALPPITMHHRLQYSLSPVLNFDIGLPPSRCTISTHHRTFSLQVLAEPATKPSLPYLTVTSPHLPWTIKLSASRGGFVTVRDVLEGIYPSLRTSHHPTGLLQPTEPEGPDQSLPYMAGT